VLENRALRRIFGTERHEVTGGSRELHNEELHELHNSQSIIRMIKARRLGRQEHVARMGKKRNADRIMVGELERKKLLRRPRNRWMNTIKMFLGEIEKGGKDCIHLAPDRDQWRALIETVMDLRVP
jgi:hypothetical protein